MRSLFRLPCRWIRSLALLVGVLGAWSAAPAAAHAPHDHVPVLELSPHFERDGTIFAALLLTDHQFFGRSTDGGRTWSVTGPAMALEVLTSFAFSPAFGRDGTAFAGTLVGGVYRTRDAGLSWHKLDLGPGFLNVRALALSPGFVADGTLAAATSMGCRLSFDGGDTWAPANLGLTETDLSVIAFDGDARRLYAGRQTLHLSADAGGTWAPLSRLPAAMTSLVLSEDISPALGGSLAASFGGAGFGVAVSHDGGLSFAPATVGLQDLRVNQLDLADDGTLFASTWSQGCLRAASAGASWSVVFEGLGLTSQTSNHFRTVRVSPAFSRDGVALCGSFEGLMRSDDGGDTWRQLETYGINVLRALALPDDFARTGVIYAGSYGGGLMRLSPGPGGLEAAQSQDWVASATGVVNPFSGAMAVSPNHSEDGTLFWAYTSLHRSDNAGRTLIDLPKPDITAVRAMAVSPDFAHDRSLVIGAGSGPLYLSQDAGASWSALPGLPQDPGARSLCFAPDYAVSGTLFLATKSKGVFRTVDRGQHWQALGLAGNKLRSLAVSPNFPSDRTLVVGGERSGVWVSRDAGDTWQASRRGLPEVSAFGVEDVAFSPDFARDGELFFTATAGGVWRSRDRAVSWTWAGQGLPPQAGRKLAVSPSYPRDRTLVQTNHDWIWISTDAGDHWSRLPGMLRADDGHQSVSQSGTWGADDPLGSLDFANGTHSSLEPGATTELTFFGHQVTWFARKGPNNAGVVRVSIDGVLLERFSLYASELQTQAAVFQRELTPGWHTIRVTHTGQQDPRGTSALIRSDGFAYRF